MSKINERTKIFEDIAKSDLNKTRLLAFIAECYTDKLTLARNILNIQGRVTKDKAIKVVDEFFEQEVV